VTTTVPRHTGITPFLISRTLDAPRSRVWDAWTQTSDLQAWFAPPGCTLPTIRLDLRPGGTCHYAMRTPDGHLMWGRWTFREIAAPERLVLVQSFSDAAGGITAHPMSPTWPRETLASTTLSESGGRTTLTVDWRVWNGTEEEHRTFDGAHAQMQQGWGGTMDQLATYLHSSRTAPAP
jgi:uncharacterized protein YndB with AHSA1/START domain